MKYSTFLFFTLFSLSLSGQGIFDASIHTAVAFGDVNSPGAEGPQQVIDQNSATKFLDFNTADGIGFEVDLLGVAQVAASMEFVTANDVPQRDPINYEILGSNDGVDFTSVATGTIPCVSDRFLSRTFGFENENSYTFYRLNFTGFCDPTNINQIADIQLYAAIGNVPTITCPTDTVMVNTSVGECTGIADYDVMANDAEDGPLFLELVTGNLSGTPFGIGTTPVVYSTQDSDGNLVSCDFIVSVTDTEDPVAGCPDNITVMVDEGTTEATVEYEVTPTDNCSVINPKEGFIPLGSLDGQAYYLSASTFFPVDALVDAEEQGGTLGTIRSEADNQYINEAILRIINLEVLIGYTDISSEGDFLWVSDDPSTYSNWNMGEPNDAMDNEDFTIMQGNGGWNDISEQSGPYLYLYEETYSPIQSAGMSSGSTFPLGTTTNTFEVFDEAGNSNSCSFEVTVEVASSTAEEETLARETILSPNPVSNRLTLTPPADVAIEKLSVYQLDGRVIREVSTNSSSRTLSFEVGDLKPGSYYLRIQTDRGTIMKPFIRQ